MSEYAFGHLVVIYNPLVRGRNGKIKSQLVNKYQNFFRKPLPYRYKNKNESFDFAPFAFSGVTITRNGDGLEASIVFPANRVAYNWASNAVDENYFMEVAAMRFDPDNKTTQKLQEPVNTYIGQIVGSSWDNVAITLQLSSVLDAVGSDVPRRSLTRGLVGNLPISNNVRLQ